MPEWLRLAHALILLLTSPEPRWHEVLAPGRGCLPPACAPGQMPLALPVVVHGDRLFFIGDGAEPSRVYESSDGRDWHAHEHNAKWGRTWGAAHASFRGAIWRVGGFSDTVNQRILRSEVWRSADGRAWERVLERAPWTPRAHAHLVAFRDTLWLIGGEPDDGSLWLTVNGVTWIPRSARGLPRQSPQGVVAHAGALWILGHGAWENAANDVWSSADGVTWHRVTATAPWPARTGAGFAALKDQLWVIGGAGRSDVWSSADGLHWSRASDALPGPPRAANYSAVFQSGIWVFGGKTGGAGGTGFWDGVSVLR